MGNQQALQGLLMPNANMRFLTDRLNIYNRQIIVIQLFVIIVEKDYLCER